MTVHLLINPDGEPFGVYKDGELIKEAWRLSAFDILKALGINAHMIFYDEEDMKRLPHMVGAIPITEILTEDHA